MKHIDPIREMQSFVDGTLRAGELAACQAHLDVCGECQELYERISETNRILYSLATQLRTQSPAAAEIDQALARCRDRIHDGRKEPMARAPRLAVLHALLTPLCGTRAAMHLLSVAGGPEESHPRRAGELEWNGFVARLVPLVRCLCGETAAQLVGEVASL